MIEESYVKVVSRNEEKVQGLDLVWPRFVFHPGLREFGVKSKKVLIKQILREKMENQSAPRVKHEFQEYGIWLTEQLHDKHHKALYIKLAKERSRSLLEKARIFTIDYKTKSANRGRLFMWKLAELEKEQKNKRSPSRL